MKHLRLTLIACLTTLAAVACSYDDASSESPLHGDGMLHPPGQIDQGETFLIPDAGPPDPDRPADRVRCHGGESDDMCDEGEICCPATMFCVPVTCPDCCNTDAYHRFEPIEAPPIDEIPVDDLAGPRPPNDEPFDDDADVPEESAPRGGNTPGPMPAEPPMVEPPPLPVSGGQGPDDEDDNPPIPNPRA